MPYLGNEPAVAYTSTTKDSFSGDGSTTVFTMSKSANVNAVRVVVENVIQDPTVAYTCSGTTLTFTSAPPSGTNNIYVVHLGPPAATVAPPTTINNATTYTDALTVNGAFTSQGIDDNADATAITIDSSENVGIGTTSPTAPLDVRISGASGKTAEFHNNSGYGVDIGSDSNSVAYISSGYTQALAFKTDPSSGQTERIRIHANGLFGINSGTTDVGYGPLLMGSTSLGVTVIQMLNSTSGAAGLHFGDGTSGSDRYKGYVIYDHNGDSLKLNSSQFITLMIGESNRMVLDDNEFYPSPDNYVTLGWSGGRFVQIYAVSGSINTSDRNEKQDIEDLSEAEKRVAVAAKGLIKKYRWIDAVEKKGDDARIHVGIIAQDLQAAFEAEGLDPHRYGMFCSDTWWEKDRTVPATEDKEEHTVTDSFRTQEEAPEGATERTRLGVRYEELLAFIIGAM